jgi:hypothetical protein
MMNPNPPFTFSILARAARAALQWRLLLLWVLWMLVPTAILGVTMWQLLRASLDYSVHAAEFAQQLDMTVLTDLMAAHGKNVMAFTHAGVLALIATLLISPLLTGMAVTAARAQGTPGFRALTAGGLSEYPRMLRMLVWSVVPLALAALIGNAALEAAAERDAAAIVASDASLWSVLATTCMVIMLALAHATVDAGRAALALDRRRGSVVLAWWAGCKLLLARPFATMSVYALISAAGLGLAAALAVGRINLAGTSVAGFVAAFLLVQVTVAVLGWMRSARLFVLIELARSEKR